MASQPVTTTAALPRGAAGQWCHVTVHIPGAPGWWAQLALVDEARGHVVRSSFLGRAVAVQGGTRRATLVHVPAEAAFIQLRIYGSTDAAAAVRVARLGRAGAALRLLWGGRRLIWPALRGAAQGRLGRLRAMLGQAPARAGEAPDYAAWIAWFEPHFPPPPPAPRVDVTVAVADGAGVAATLASIARQSWQASAAPVVIRTGADWRLVTGPHVVVVRAGDILAPDALAWFAHGFATHQDAGCIVADTDEIDGGGARSNPLFKPGADRMLLDTGVLLRGACGVQWPARIDPLPMTAESALRLLVQGHTGRLVHVPRILTHCPRKAVAPAPLSAAPRQPSDYAPTVTAIVPSAVRAPHVPRCLRRVVEATAYPHFSVLVAVSDTAHASAGLLRQLAALPKIHVQRFHVPRFNYATVNNKAAAVADGALLLLLNDDVAPVDPGWLASMVAHMRDPAVGIVGARLLYGNGLVQHEGVIMGLAGLCEHVGRLRNGADGGPHGLGLMDRRVSAVTAACLLIRAEVFRALGGMDESFAIALNDVDLCLRARAAGWDVVYDAHATLHHYESLSLGRHYDGARGALEAVEVRRLRADWADMIDADPFYNPLASLEPGREWQPAFPPRIAAASAPAPNHAASGSEKS